jgi:hypothetical protein
MTPGAQDLESFARLIDALGPWLNQVVIVGGWAHRLYRLHPNAQELSYPPLMTLDTDVAVPANVLPVGEQDIRDRLLSHGFIENLLGENRPPATHYHLGSEGSGFYAEFLTPLIGREYGRGNKRKATLSIAGVTSQQLRYIELLLRQPWSVDFESGQFAANIRIANPVSYLAQKLLIHGKRDREDRAKDILYMHDTMEVFGARLPELRDLWRTVVAPQVTGRTALAISGASETLFGKVSDDVRRASQISVERGLSPEAIRAACSHGFDQVFGK